MKRYFYEPVAGAYSNRYTTTRYAIYDRLNSREKVASCADRDYAQRIVDLLNATEPAK